MRSDSVDWESSGWYQPIERFLCCCMAVGSPGTRVPGLLSPGASSSFWFSCSAAVPLGRCPFGCLASLNRLRVSCGCQKLPMLLPHLLLIDRCRCHRRLRHRRHRCYRHRRRSVSLDGRSVGCWDEYVHQQGAQRVSFLFFSLLFSLLFFFFFFFFFFSLVGIFAADNCSWFKWCQVPAAVFLLSEDFQLDDISVGPIIEYYMDAESVPSIQWRDSRFQARGGRKGKRERERNKDEIDLIWTKNRPHSTRSWIDKPIPIRI